MPSRNSRGGPMHVFLEILRCILCFEEKSQDDSDFDDEIYQKDPLLKSLSSSSNRSLGWNYKVYQSSSNFIPYPTIPSYKKSTFSQKTHQFSTSSSSPSSSDPPTSSSELPQSSCAASSESPLSLSKLFSSSTTSEFSSSTSQCPTKIPSSSEKPPLLSVRTTASSSRPSASLAGPNLPPPTSPQTVNSVLNVYASEAIKKAGKTNHVVEKTVSQKTHQFSTSSSSPSSSNSPASSSISPHQEPTSSSELPQSSCAASSEFPLSRAKLFPSSTTTEFSSSTPQCPKNIPSSSEKPPLLSVTTTASSSRPSASIAGPNLLPTTSPQTVNSVLNVYASEATKKAGKTNHVVEKSLVDAITHYKPSSITQSPLKLPSSSNKETLSTKITASSSGPSPFSSVPVLPTPISPQTCNTVQNVPASKATRKEGKTTIVWVKKSPRGVKTPDKTTYIRQSPPNLPSSSEKPPLSSPKTTPSSRSFSSFDELPFHPVPVLHSPISPPVHKSVLRIASSNGTKIERKVNYVWVEKSTIYAIPREIKSLIKEDIVPEILKRPLSRLTYKDYFAALLYAEDFYLEKWSKFKLENVVLESEEAEINKYLKWKKNMNERVKDEDKTFVVFEIDSIPEKRPFLLSRDLVYARPSGSEFEPFQGIIHRVAKSTKVLVEFGEDFYRKHCPSCRYDISFSFNRVCLKRGHQAVEAASAPLFQNFLFPDCPFRGSILTPPSVLSVDRKLKMDHLSVTQLILRIQRPPPFLVEGPLCATDGKISRTGILVRDTISKLYQTSQDCRILVCAPTNKTCDVLTRSLQEDIPDFDLFRANAAFRDIDDEDLIDILPYCLLKGECFACPLLQELIQYRVIISTYMSSFRLHNAGITAGHFSHIFLLDASSATEPETMVALINLADENTAVIVTGKRGNHSCWVHSDIGRKHGLSKSYFERLSESKQYNTLDPMFIAQI